MSVYIPNLEMPISCFKCPVSRPSLGNLGGAIIGCPLIGRTISALFCEQKRMQDCPLVPVPQHGRLIDADAMIERIEFEARHYVVKDEFDKGRVAAWYNVIRAIREYIPTIIQASKESE